MEAECLSLKDLTSPRKSFPMELEEDGGQSEQKVSWTFSWISGPVWACGKLNIM